MGVCAVISKESRNTFASLCKNTERRKTRSQFVRYLLIQRRTCYEVGGGQHRGPREHFTLLLLDLCLETGSLFGPLYLLGPLAIYLEAQSAVCNITVSCRGNCDVNTSAFWLQEGNSLLRWAPCTNKYIPKQQVSLREARSLVSTEMFLPLNKHWRKHKHLSRSKAWS